MNTHKQLSKFNDFWKPKALDQLFNNQNHQPVKSVFDFVTDFWPVEESVDDFNQCIYSQRHNYWS